MADKLLDGGGGRRRISREIGVPRSSSSSSFGGVGVIEAGEGFFRFAREGDGVRLDKMEVEGSFVGNMTSSMNSGGLQKRNYF